MAIAFDIATGNTGTGTSSNASLNHAANVLVLVGVSFLGTTSPTSVTIAGVGMTSFSKISQSTNMTSQCYYAYRTSAANESIVVTFSGSTRHAWSAASYTGAENAEPTEGKSQNTGSGASPQDITATVPSGSANRIVVQSAAVVDSANGTGSIANAPQDSPASTERQERQLAGGSSAKSVGVSFQEYAAGSSVRTMTARATKSGRTLQWATTAVAILEAPTPVGQTSQSIWNVRSLIAQTRQSIWHARANLGKTVQSIWNVTTAVAQTRQAIWNVRAALGKTSQSIWNVRATLGKASQSIWNVATVIGKSSQAIWNVLAGIVAWRTFELIWHTRATVGQTRQAVWNIRSLVAQSIGAVWTILTSLGKTTQTVWKVRALVAKSAQTIWNVLANALTAGRNLQSLWHYRSRRLTFSHKKTRLLSLTGQVENQFQLTSKLGKGLILTPLVGTAHTITSTLSRWLRLTSTIGET